MSTKGRAKKEKDATAAAAPTAEKKTTSRKKQFPVIALITPDGIEGNLQPEIRKPLIAHLPIKSCDVTFYDNGLHYNPAPPEQIEAYDANEGNYFSTDIAANASDAQVVVEQPADVTAPHHAHTGKPAEQAVDTDTYKNIVLMAKFKDSSDARTLPEETDVACFWCCHTFEGRPVVLPVRDEGEYLQVFGNFCCPECAMSYLFDIRQDSHTRWEQLALLNRVYGESVGGTIRPAPSRSVLRMFGGPMSIEEFRGVVRQKKVRIDIHIPPMVSLLSTMDTKPIDFYDANLTKNVMETVKERLQKAEEVLKLRRTKPLKAWESTLDACMNLRVRTAGEKI